MRSPRRGDIGMARPTDRENPRRPDDAYVAPRVAMDIMTTERGHATVFTAAHATLGTRQDSANSRRISAIDSHRAFRISSTFSDTLSRSSRL